MQILACIEHAWQLWSELIDFIGVRFDSSKDQLPTTELEMLGNVEVFSDVAFDRFIVTAKPARIADLISEIDSIMHARKLATGQAASLRGKLLHVSHTQPGRLGLATLGALIANGKCNSWSSNLTWELDFARMSLLGVVQRTFAPGR